MESALCLDLKVSKVGVKGLFRHRVVAAEISRLTRHLKFLAQVFPTQHDTGQLLGEIECDRKLFLPDVNQLPDPRSPGAESGGLLLNGILNHHLDIQGLLTELHGRMSRSSRLIVVAFNPYLSRLIKAAHRVFTPGREPPSTFVTRTDLLNLARLSGFEVTRERPVLFFPWFFLGLGPVLNWLLPAVPFLRLFPICEVILLRPVIRDGKKPSLSVVIPARNERGNIENALKRMPDFGAPLEIIFVEGHSSDGTWDEIQRVAEAYKNKFSITCLQQSGKGKNDAVRAGFSAASHDLLTILDADLTMPPEMLSRFYEAYYQGNADFINGTRLVYPMEGEAMRFLNRLGNIFFAKALSYVLDCRLGDSLCGTKLLTRLDYERIKSWRVEFGDFDPFGDFELLFPAAIFGLGVVDIPIRYRARTYGSTNINRFSHGFELLRMTTIGLFRIKTGPKAS